MTDSTDSTDSTTPTPTPTPTPRKFAEERADSAVGHLEEADAFPMYDAKELHHLGWAQVNLLQAIYAELRHGHDQQERLLKQQIDVAGELAAQVKSLKIRLNR